MKITSKAKNFTGSAKAFYFLISNKAQHIYQNIFRITASGNDRITSSGKTRITSKSDY